MHLRLAVRATRKPLMHVPETCTLPWHNIEGVARLNHKREHLLPGLSVLPTPRRNCNTGSDGLHSYTTVNGSLNHGFDHTLVTYEAFVKSVEAIMAV